MLPAHLPQEPSALKPTEEGTLASHAKNGVVEGAEALAGGAAVKTASKGVHFLYNKLTGPTGVTGFTLKVLDKSTPSTSLIDKPAITSHYNLRSSTKSGNDAANNLLLNPLGPGRFVSLASNVSRAEIRSLLRGNELNLTAPQTKKIFYCLGRGQATNVTLKVNSYGMARLYVERPSHTSGYQRFSYEITPTGESKAIIQTAFDNYNKLVSQNPGASKNNLFDVKKYSGSKE